MADPARREATYDDLLAIPEPLIAQLIDGEVHAHPRPGSAHARGTSKLGGWLDRHFDDDDGGGSGGWVILDEPELHFGRDILVPDIAGWRRSAMPEMPLAPHFTLAPDWVCEGLSPGTAHLDRGRKLDIYAREHVAHAWLFDPEARTLEIYGLKDDRWVRLAVHVGDVRVRAEPFESVELPLARLWGR